MNLSERYQQAELIGEGMSSKVYKAFDLQTKTWVAIKHINPHIANDPIGIKRFYREVQITRSIAHPGVINIFDLNNSEQGVFLVMELLTGYDLNTYLSLHAPVHFDTVCNLLSQLLDILKSCHERNIIHRDIKPQNIFILDDGSIKLIDFGISRMASLSDITQTGTSLGSPEYMAPELFSSNVYDPRNDLYSVGVVAYQLLTGQKPFDGETLPILFRQHAESNPRRVTDLATATPAWIDDFIFKLIAKKAVDRYQSASEAIYDLESQMVFSKKIPKLGRQNCIQCAKPTLIAIPVCFHCGYEENFAKGGDSNFSVWLEPGFDPQNLEIYKKETLRQAFDNSILPKRQSIRWVDGLSLSAASLIKKQAQRYGVALEVRQDSFGGFVKANPILLAVGVALALLTGSYLFQEIATQWARNARMFLSMWGAEPSLFINYFSLLPQAVFSVPSLLLSHMVEDETRMLFIMIATTSAFLARWLTYFFKAFSPAMISAQNRTRNLSLIDVAFFSKIRVQLKHKKTDVLNETDLAIVEKGLLIASNSGEDRLQLIEAAESAVITGLKVTALMAELLSEQHSRKKVNTEEAFDLDDFYSRLNNKLIYVHAHLNSLSAKLLFIQDVSLSQDLEQLELSLRATGAELESYAELHVDEGNAA